MPGEGAQDVRQGIFLVSLLDLPHETVVLAAKRRPADAATPALVGSSSTEDAAGRAHILVKFVRRSG